MEGRKKLERRVGVGEWEWGGYGRVEHVERVENAEPRQIRRGVIGAVLRRLPINRSGT